MAAQAISNVATVVSFVKLLISQKRVPSFSCDGADITNEHLAALNNEMHEEQYKTAYNMSINLI